MKKNCLQFYHLTQEVLSLTTKRIIPTYLPVPNKHVEMLCKPQGHSKTEVTALQIWKVGTHPGDRGPQDVLSSQPFKHRPPFTSSSLSRSTNGQGPPKVSGRADTRGPCPMASVFQQLLLLRANGQAERIWVCGPTGLAHTHWAARPRATCNP